MQAAVARVARRALVGVAKPPAASALRWSGGTVAAAASSPGLQQCAACRCRSYSTHPSPATTPFPSSSLRPSPLLSPLPTATQSVWPPPVDTIYQLSSGLGGASSTESSRAPSAVGVAIIRISGPLALPLLLTLTRRTQPPKPRMATRVNLYQPSDDNEIQQRFTEWRQQRGQSELTKPVSPPASFSPSAPMMIDSGILTLYFPAPHSFTGEDVVELHVHGTPLLVHNTFAAIEKINSTLVRKIVDPRGSSIGAGQTADHADDSSDPSTLARASSLLSFPPLLRLSSPGEFTRRAFHSGKLDLTQVEALGDLLAAQTDRQRDQALVQMRGELGELYTQWRLDLLNSLAYIEAVLDFSEDEQDVGEAEVVANVLPKVRELAASLRAHLADSRRGELVRSGIAIVIAGAPNAGKSTLLNALSKRNVAIVSPVPGTTRDIVENQLNIAGWACVLSDTAGLRQLHGDRNTTSSSSAVDAAAPPQDALSSILSGHDLIEAEGMKRTRERLDQSDIKLVLLDGSAAAASDGAAHQFDPQVLDMIDERTIVVWTKMDLLPPPPPDTATSSVAAAAAPAAPSASTTGRAKLRAAQAFYDRTRDAFSPAQTAHYASILSTSPAFKLVQQRQAQMVFLACGASSPSSSQTEANSSSGNKGIQNLLSVLEQQIQRTVGLDGTPNGAPARSSSSSSSSPSLPLITRARHRAHVSACASLLDLFEGYMDRGDLVLAAEQLRLATREIGKITGQVDVEELLDVIFEDFCIGK